MAKDLSMTLRGAEHMVVRILLNDLFSELCLTRDDPVGEVKRRSELSLGALDNLAETTTNQLFTQYALHEMETFWKGVRLHVEGQVAARSR